MTAQAFRVPWSRYHSPERLLGALANWRSASDLFGPVVPDLERLAHAALGSAGQVRTGRIFSSSISGAELRVFLECGARVGAAVTCHWKPGSDSFQVTVGPLSPLQAKLRWIWLTMGILLVSLSMKATRPSLGLDPYPALLLAVLVGTGLGVLFHAVAVRLGIAADRASCNMLSQRLAREVGAWASAA
jgi:hypothetical protein